ncbi:BREX-2 system phosphatase PglZ [Stackebrandtia albiflava]|nr:BREX-2 system phosphatase PglZ [Stackebrandtia albiflava]
MSVSAGTVLPEARQTMVHAKVVELLKQRAAKPGESAVLLLQAAPVWNGPETFPVPGGDSHPGAEVRVVPADSPLAVMEALSGASKDEVTVIVSPYGDELGANVLARVYKRRAQSLDLWEIIRVETGALRLGTDIGKQHDRLAEAVLATPNLLTRIRGQVLRRADLLERLAAHRLGYAPTHRVDAATLLEWSRDDSRVHGYLQYPATDIDELDAYLVETVGPVAQIVLGLARHRKNYDAIPLGLLLAEIYGDSDLPPDAVADAKARLEVGYFPADAPTEDALRTFGETCLAFTTRWSDNVHTSRAVTDMYDRAAAILTELRATRFATHSGLLSAGFDARSIAFANQIARSLPAPNRNELDAAEESLARLIAHRVARREPERGEPARCAMRLLRWLATPTPDINSISAGVEWQIREGAWVDRALRMIRRPDLAGGGSAFAALFEACRARRAALDAAFAKRLAAWHGQDTERLVLAESLLTRIARPVAEQAAPLIIVIDGATAADGIVLAEQLTAQGWRETGRDETGREGALSVLPSATRYSRTSLLSGRLVVGGQHEEDTGFTRFWGRRTAKLFHKDDLRPGIGEQISAEVTAALAEPSTVVGVVLNTIDEALNSDERMEEPLWNIDRLDYLKVLMKQSALAGRPVVITSDHGHISDFGEGTKTLAGESARYRTAVPPPGDGELVFSGPRVLHRDGTVVLPYDERIRYGNRKAGYHGGASLAETVIPILVFLPAGVKRPVKWHDYDKPERHEPVWWNKGVAAEQTPPTRRAPRQTETLFDTDTLGHRLCATPLYAAQRDAVRHKPRDEQVITLINALAEAGGRLPIARVAELVELAVFRIDGYIATLQRILNLDGYRVLAKNDDDRTIVLDRKLLSEQFLGGRE